MIRRRIPLLLAVALLATVPAHAWAQGAIKNRMTLSTTTITFPTPTETDYDQTPQGFVAASNSILVTFDASKAGGPSSSTQRTSIISISGTTTGAKAIGDFQWEKSGGTWTSLTGSDVTVDSKPFVFNGLNDPWTVTVLFRSLLNWATDVPGTYTATITFKLTVTTP